MITFKQFLDEKAMNPKVFSGTIDRLSSSAKMGFELEMWVPEDSDLLIIKDEDSSKGDFQKTAKEAQKSLEDLLGVDVIVGEGNLNQWKIVPDGSIQEAGLGIGIEVVSPPTPVEDALADLKQCFKWMMKHDVITNSTTGIHLNLSIPDLKDKLDPLKLILFMGEEHVLKSYGRDTNTYAQKHSTDLINSIKDMGTIPKKFSFMHGRAYMALKKEKYRTVNLSKLEHGYLEFRTGGNENYHGKFGQIQSDVGRFLTILDLACDPEAEKKEYIKKLVRLYDMGKEARLNSSRRATHSGSKPESLDADLGETSMNLLRGYSEQETLTTGDEERVISRLLGVIVGAATDIYDGRIEISVKKIAEFKLLLAKLGKKVPDLMSRVRAAAKSQVELDSLKAFKKAFNLK